MKFQTQSCIYIKIVNQTKGRVHMQTHESNAGFRSNVNPQIEYRVMNQLHFIYPKCFRTHSKLQNFEIFGGDFVGDIFEI